MMKKVWLAGLAVLALSAIASTAAADPPQVQVQPQGSGVYQMQTIVVYGRPQHPGVVITITRPSAASQAGAAHESVKRTLWAEAQRFPLRATPEMP